MSSLSSTSAAPPPPPPRRGLGDSWQPSAERHPSRRTPPPAAPGRPRSPHAHGEWADVREPREQNSWQQSGSSYREREPLQSSRAVAAAPAAAAPPPAAYVGRRDSSDAYTRSAPYQPGPHYAQYYHQQHQQQQQQQQHQHQQHQQQHEQQPQYPQNPPHQPPAAPQWYAYMDAASGRPYYYNPRTGVRQWEMPPEMMEGADQRAQPPPQQHNPNSTPSPYPQQQPQPAPHAQQPPPHRYDDSSAAANHHSNTPPPSGSRPHTPNNASSSYEASGFGRRISSDSIPHHAPAAPGSALRAVSYASSALSRTPSSSDHAGARGEEASSSRWDSFSSQPHHGAREATAARPPAPHLNPPVAAQPRSDGNASSSHPLHNSESALGRSSSGSQPHHPPPPPQPGSQAFTREQSYSGSPHRSGTEDGAPDGARRNASDSRNNSSSSAPGNAPLPPPTVTDPATKCRLHAASALFEMEKARMKSFMAMLDRRILDIRIDILDQRYKALLQNEE